MIKRLFASAAAALLLLPLCFAASAAVIPPDAVIMTVPNNTAGTYINCPIYDYTVYMAEDTKGQFVKLADGIKLEGKTYNRSVYIRQGKILMASADFNTCVSNGQITITDNNLWGENLIACSVVDSQKFSTSYSEPTYLTQYGFTFTDTLQCSMTLKNGYLAATGTTFSSYIGQGKVTLLTEPYTPSEPDPPSEPESESEPVSPSEPDTPSDPDEIKTFDDYDTITLVLIGVWCLVGIQLGRGFSFWKW